MATTATVTFDATLRYEDSTGVKINGQTTELEATPSAYSPHQNVQVIGTSIEAIDLGDCTAPGYCHFKNLDPTNYVELYTSLVSGKAFAKLLPNGGTAQLYLGSDAQAPAAQAHTDVCRVKITLTPT